jgi:hypothetical protein
MKNSKVQSLIREIRFLEKEIDNLKSRVETLEAVNNLLTYTPNNTPLSNSTEIVDGIPNCCKGCSNHPSNGGSGICHCTLPYFENPLKWGVTGVTFDYINNSNICFDGTSNTYTKE